MSHGLHAVEDTVAPAPTLTSYVQERSDLHRDLQNLASRVYDLKANLMGLPTSAESDEKAQIAAPWPGQIEFLNKGNIRLNDIIYWMNDNLCAVEQFLK